MMTITKTKSLSPVLAAAILFALLLPVAAQAGETDMKNLVVKLGFDRVPDKCTCQGIDVSPRIEIHGLNATSLAVIVDDPDAPSGVFTHWHIWNIPPMDVIPEAIAKKAAINEPFIVVQGTNDFGRPCDTEGRSSGNLWEVILSGSLPFPFLKNIKKLRCSPPLLTALAVGLPPVPKAYL